MRTKLAMPSLVIPRNAVRFGMRADVAPTLAQLKEATALIEKLTADFTKKSDELSKAAEGALAEVKDKGALLAESKAMLDKLLVEHTTMTAEKNKAEARLTTIEQELVRRGEPRGTPTARLSAGAQMAASEKLKAFATENVRGKFRHEVKAAITSVDIPSQSNADGGIVPPLVVPGTIVAPKQRLFVRDLIPVGQTGSPAIFWVQQTGFVNNARVVTEGQRKPESTITYTPKMTGVATIAHIWKGSRQILSDFKQLASDVDREMRYGLKFVEEEEILLGDGVGNHLEGIVPQASDFDPAFEVERHNRIDDIRLAILQSQLARLPATGIVMHFLDWAKTELTKDANGQYVFANPLRLATPNLWGLPVVPTEIGDFLGKFLTGAFAGGAQIYDREEMAVEIATENEDDFVKNMITGRCEERVGLAVFRPEAFIFGPFSNPT